jgi:hypothetical protein
LTEEMFVSVFNEIADFLHSTKPTEGLIDRSSRS